MHKVGVSGASWNRPASAWRGHAHAARAAQVPTSRVGVTAAAGAGGASSSAAATATAAPPAAASSPAAPDWSERFRVRSVPEQFRETRQKVCKEFLAGGLLYLESGEAPARNGSDVFHRHRSHSHFVYVTGCMAPGYGALIDAETGHFTLLAPRLPEEAAYWVGAVPSLEQLQQQYGADRVAYMDELKALLAAAAAAGGGRDLHTLPGPAADKLKTVVPAGCRVTSDILPSTIDRCRATKTDAEVACLYTASVASGAAHMDMWRACRPGLTEFQLEAVFAMSSRCRGAPDLGYPVIVGTGPNAAVMHYEAGPAAVEPGHLVLVDAGAEWRCYTADISRTFPASGRFEGAARDLYASVLEAQHRALEVLSAGGGSGVSLQDGDRAARVALLEGLRGMGLLRPEAAGGSGWLDAALDLKVDRTFMPHGVGHHLGLDVHDTSDTGPVPKGPLAPGMVVTVEPGAYLIPPLLAKARADPKVAPFINFDLAESLAAGGLGGVRIEDNVLLLDGSKGARAGAGTGAGAGVSGGVSGAGVQGRLFNLTVAAGCAKEMREVEDVMAEEWRPAEAMSRVVG
ncbi:hypothetical protein CHLRE_02g083065v5 [Chlamydomonas reinhardtii]|uniref:Aminopeptidase P N-terminal domain-containing protein n=1 Tax=Chlamydomonas reinhardtii TaxID=3055 RepID=A0A2K3E0M0_CHLRE|nr:uncharacterized protein CHLRE_02g083065v5 [Chlamydomonas reinhardtii]PNW86350.1 hypothetical protein CHLRE_02g083065v5 [Chlamydomonas reinhardtii]